MKPSAGLLLVLLAALAIRVVLPTARPMHADEAILADITDTLRVSHSYRYNAADYHGPALPFFGAILPAVPAIAGATLALFITATLGVPAGLLIALSPAMVYWSRFYIPEMLLALFSALWIYTLRSRELALWRAAGILAAAMLATKETAILAFIAAAAAWVLTRTPPPPRKPFLLLCSLAAFLGLAAFTSGFRDWTQLALLPQSLLNRAGSPGHAHPFWWYFSVLRWELLAIPLAALAWRKDRFLAAYALSLALLYCLIPYKTPWCAVQFWWPVLALAGQTAKWPYPLAAIFGVVSIFTSLLYPASPSNPYAYAQTLPEALAIPERITALAAGRHKVQFFSTQNLWPLPHYLRGVKDQEWSRDVDFNSTPAPIVVVTPELEPKLTEWLYERRPPGERSLYMRVFEKPVFLRPGVEVRVYCAAGVMR
jgi:predicted membrane-bound mannosyltransferase